jgi:hypothetical protein
MESAPNINARCEMDLSPGTWTRPESGPDLAAARIGMIVADTVSEFRGGVLRKAASAP